jgi:hypothetical protein
MYVYLPYKKLLLSYLDGVLLQAVQSESLDEDSTEDTPLFSPDCIESFPSQPHHYYVIQEKIEMVCKLQAREPINASTIGQDFCVKNSVN